MVRSLWDWNWGDPAEGALSRLRTALDRVFEGFGSEYPTPFAASFPRMNLSETADHYLLQAEVPGLRLDQVEITCSGHDLTLRGERKEEGDPEESYARRERPSGAFTRTVSLPSELDPDKVTATLEDGILEIVVPKSESAKPRRIEVKTSASVAREIEVPGAEQPQPAEGKK